ncbi:hypothetical protein HYV84_02275 [Candidatus Woesearchaeota archaeon]|nr:hypothetical protein [Candidatus Woesearchaeota archaeon]
MLLTKIFHQTVAGVKTHKKIFFILLALQLIFASLLAFVLFRTIPPATAEARKALEFIEAAEDAPAEEGPVQLQNPYLLAAASKKMYGHFRRAGFWSAILFLVFNTGLWVLSLRIANPWEKAHAFRTLITLGVNSSIFVLVLAQLGVANLRSALVDLDEGSPFPFISSLIIVLLILIVTPVALSLSQQKPKELLQLWLKTLAFRPLKIIGISFLAAIVLILIAAFAFLTAEISLVIDIITAALLLFAIVFLRLFFIVSVREIRKTL